MEVFGCLWEDYEERIFTNWEEDINDDDLVLIPGDISWALHLKDAFHDLKRIDDLPGQKLMLRGNHDYWWKSRTKIEELGLKTIHLLQNDAFEYGDIVVYGARGWMDQENSKFTEHDEKVYQRELQRLDLSLQHQSDKKIRIGMLHYPPFNGKGERNDFWDKMVSHGMDICLYGHLHGYGHALIQEGEIDGVNLHCVSADYLAFFPKKIV